MLNNFIIFYWILSFIRLLGDSLGKIEVLIGWWPVAPQCVSFDATIFLKDRITVKDN